MFHLRRNLGDTGTLSAPALGELEALLVDATLGLSHALGLVRVLTLLPLYDSSLDEIERQLARSLREVHLAGALAGSRTLRRRKRRWRRPTASHDA